MIKTIIIEDETLSVTHLIDLLEKSNLEIKIEAIISSVADSIKWLKNNFPPDLIFMDIHLSDGKSLEIFKEYKILSPVIFTTAYDEYAIQVFKTSGIEYLLKPIDYECLKEALITFSENKLIINNNHILTANSFKQIEYKKRFLVKEGKEFIPVKTEEVAYFYRTEIVFIKLFNGKSYMTNYSLNHLEKILEPHSFFRVNRQIIANVNTIKSFFKGSSGNFFLNVSPIHSEKIQISQERYYILKNLLS